MFAKNADENLASLVKQIDKVVAENKEKKLAAVINFFGDNPDELAEQVKKFGEQHKLKNVALVVTNDTDRFAVNRDAELTVMHYVGAKVAANHALGKGGLNEKVAQEIVKSIDKILK